MSDTEIMNMEEVEDEAVPTRGRTLSRTRPSRWGLEAKFGIPSTLKAEGLDNEQLAFYAFHMRIEEIGRQLRTNDYIPKSPDRSPSPEPIYGADGKRINTREYRFRKKLEDERHRMVTYAYKLDPNYRPPADYRKPTKLAEKIYIPVKEFPEINFIGLLLGPRGSTLKQMETDSCAKIAIRGKGSVKEGKGAPTSYQNQEEDLHCLITADSEDKIKIAVAMVNRIIETASTVPEAQNELKRKQLRDLAALNGTLRDDENQICQNCGALGHKRYNCPERSNVTNNIVCRICGGAGHMARDCMARNNPEVLQEARERDSKLDSEYQSLMAELGAVDTTMNNGGGSGSTNINNSSMGGGAVNVVSGINNSGTISNDSPWNQQSMETSDLSNSQYQQSSHSQIQRSFPNEFGSRPAFKPTTTLRFATSTSCATLQDQESTSALPPWASTASSTSATGFQTSASFTKPSTGPMNSASSSTAPPPWAMSASGPSSTSAPTSSAPLPNATPAASSQAPFMTQGNEDYAAYYQYYYHYAQHLQQQQQQQQ